MRKNVAAPEKLKNLKPTPFDWQFIYPIVFEIQTIQRVDFSSAIRWIESKYWKL